LWPFVQPLALFAVYAFVFSELFGMRPAAPHASPALGAVWIFAGVLVWTSFAECLSRAASAFFENRNLVQKSSFPADLLVLQPVLMSFATLGVGAVVFCCISWFVAGTHPTLSQLALSGVLLSLHFAWMLGLALSLACAQVILRDTASLLGVFLTVWMFATPIFWVADVASIPAIEPWLAWIQANPMHSLIEAWRWTLLGESAAPFANAELRIDLARFAPWALGALIVGLCSARALRGKLSDEVAV
jgi:lipopolysaccharide transport system permease protein